MGVTAAVSLAALATAYTIDKGEKDRQEQNKQRKQAEKKASRFRSEAKERNKLDEATKQRDATRKRHRKKTMGYRGRKSTILTGPEGVQGEEAQRKTLLGM